MAPPNENSPRSQSIGRGTPEFHGLRTKTPTPYFRARRVTGRILTAAMLQGYDDGVGPPLSRFRLQGKL